MSDPLPELAIDTASRLDHLRDLAYRAWSATRSLVDASTLVMRPGVRSPNVLFIGPEWRWAPLPEEQHWLQDQADDRVGAWLEQANRVVQLNAEHRLRGLQEAGKELTAILRRSPRWSNDRLKVIKELEDAFLTQLDIVRDLPGTRAPAELFWLPDTNALIHRHELAKWPSSRPAVLAIPPTVIQELDRLKVDHRVPEVRDKARSLIAQIKEFRRRSNRVIAGRLRLRNLAVWPRFANLPGWLSSEHADDQILATAIELGWEQMTSSVTLVTTDANAQDKAERLGISYVDPDEPGSLISASVSARPTLFRARSAIIFAGVRRGPGDRFLAVTGHDSEIAGFLDSGAIEVA